MANRRPGGYGGGRPNFNSGPNYNSGPGSVNPWQGGNIPGNQYNNGNPSNLLSQLSEPQAQLALALTKLLQPQQQVPSLLSMNTNPPMPNRGFGGGPGNFNRNGPGNMNNRRPQNVKPFNKVCSFFHIDFVVFVNSGLEFHQKNCLEIITIIIVINSNPE